MEPGAAAALLEDVADRTFGRSSSRTTVLGLVLSLRPSAIKVLNGL